MFATIDDPGTRVIRAWVRGSEGEFRLDVRSLLPEPSTTRRDLQRAQYMPMESSMNAAAVALTELRWTLDEIDQEGAWLIACNGEGCGKPLRDFGTTLQLEILSRTIDRSPLAVRLEQQGFAEVKL